LSCPGRSRRHSAPHTELSCSLCSKACGSSGRGVPAAPNPRALERGLEPMLMEFFGEVVEDSARGQAFAVNIPAPKGGQPPVGLPHPNQLPPSLNLWRLAKQQKPALGMGTRGYRSPRPPPSRRRQFGSSPCHEAWSPSPMGLARGIGMKEHKSERERKRERERTHTKPRRNKGRSMMTELRGAEGAGNACYKIPWLPGCKRVASCRHNIVFA
jgi:hypothetical protein